MLANDIKVVGRSFKYHRPRGIMSCGVEESGALSTIGQDDKKRSKCKSYNSRII